MKKFLLMTTIPADLQIMFIIGLIFSISTFENIRKMKSIMRNKYFLTGIVFVSIFCMPVAIYCYFVYPDWCWMYWVDSKVIPLHLTILAFAFYYIMFGGGFIAGFYIERKKRGAGVHLFGSVLFLFIVFMIIFHKRLFSVVTIEDFYKGNLIYIYHRPLLIGVVAVGIITSFFIMIYILLGFGRELDYKPDSKDAIRFIKKTRNVSVIKVYSDVKTAIEKSLSHWDGLYYLEKRMSDSNYNIIIKANFAGGGRERQGTQTSIEVILSTIEIIRSIKSDARIKIVESPSIVWWRLDGLIKGSKYEKRFKEYNVEFIDLSNVERVFYDFGGRLGGEYIPSVLLDKKCLIDIPVAKTHAFFFMSGAIKNLFGLLPNSHKFLRYHTKGFADHEGRVFLDIYRNFPPDIVIVDGTVSGEGLCPVAGTGKKTDFIMTSDDALASDIVLAKIMGIPPEKVPYINVALKEWGIFPYRLINNNALGFNAFKIKVVHHRILALIYNFIWIIIENIKAKWQIKS